MLRPEVSTLNSEHRTFNASGEQSPDSAFFSGSSHFVIDLAQHFSKDSKSVPHDFLRLGKAHAHALMRMVPVIGIETEKEVLAGHDDDASIFQFAV